MSMALHDSLRGIDTSMRHARRRDHSTAIALRACASLETFRARVRAQLQQRLPRRDGEGAQAPRRNGAAWPARPRLFRSARSSIGLQLRTPERPDERRAVAACAVDADDGRHSIASLDESPDLYVWLASDDAAALAME
jgi:hypothetical protein